MINENFKPVETGITWEEWQKLSTVAQCEVIIEKGKLFTWEWITPPGLEELGKKLPKND